MKSEIKSVAALFCMFAAAPALAADAYPNKPIRIVVAYTPAGTTDILARAIGQKLTEAWGQSVIVDNRPGANGNIGTEYAAKATPDGYTLLMTTAAPHGVNPGLYRKLGFDAVKDFAGISLVATVPNVLVVNNNMPVKDVKELIAYLRANPGKVNFGSPGYGSTGHMSTELFMSMTGTKMNHVPYKGDAGVLADVMAGQISLSFSNMPAYTPQIKAGRIRALAVSTSKRSPAAPEIPTFSETIPKFESIVWYGLLAPAGTPADIVDKLNEEVLNILRMNDAKEVFAAQGIDTIGSTPAEFAAYIKSELAKWAVVVKKSGTKVD